MTAALRVKLGSVVLLLVSLSSTSALGRIFVSATDATCGGQAPCFSTIQAGVDAAAPGEEVSVAAGTYTGVAAVELSGNIYHQVVMITDSVVLQGGYADDDWTTPDPATNVTTIDAEGAGRGVSIVGSRTEDVTVDGFVIGRGDYTGLGNAPGERNVCPRTSSDCAGGLLARDALVRLSRNVFENNVSSTVNNASNGGAVLLWDTVNGSTVADSEFIDNMANFMNSTGGAIQIEDTGELAITGCRFRGNQSYDDGGAVGIFQPGGRIEILDSVFIDNRSFEQRGGAIEARLTLDGPALSLERLVMRLNSAKNYGAAVAIERQALASPSVALTNLILDSNTVDSPPTFASVIDFIGGGSPEGLTVAVNQVTWTDHPGLSALRAGSTSGGSLRVTVTNALIEDAENAFVGDENNGEVELTHTNTFTNNVTSLEATEFGTPMFNGTDPMTGNPMLDPEGFLTAGSDAIDAGIDSGVPDDIEGELRPAGPAFDVGADEFGDIFLDGFESGNTAVWSATIP